MFSKDEVKAIKQQFWHKLENRTRRLPGQKGQKKKWLFDSTGIKGLDLRFEVDRSMVRVALEINHRDENRRLMLYEKLEACKSLFTDIFGKDDLIWDFAYTKMNGQEVCRVYVEKEGDMLREELWGDMFYFMIDNMIRFEAAFLEVQDFLMHDEFQV